MWRYYKKIIEFRSACNGNNAVMLDFTDETVRKNSVSPISYLMQHSEESTSWKMLLTSGGFRIFKRQGQKLNKCGTSCILAFVSRDLTLEQIEWINIKYPHKHSYMFTTVSFYSVYHAFSVHILRWIIIVDKYINKMSLYIHYIHYSEF